MRHKFISIYFHLIISISFIMHMAGKSVISRAISERFSGGFISRKGL